VQDDRAMLQVLEGIIQEGIDTGQISSDRDAFSLVRMFFVFARGIVFDWSLQEGDYNLEETMQDYISQMLKTI